MSWEAISAAFQAQCTVTQKAVLLALANFADASGARAFPAALTLARLASVSERTARQALAGLRSAGLIELTHPSIGRLPSGYRLTFMTPAPTAPLQIEQGSTMQMPHGDPAATMRLDHGDPAAAAPNPSERDPRIKKDAPARAYPAGRARSPENGRAPDPRNSPDPSVRIAAIEREMVERRQRLDSSTSNAVRLELERRSQK